MAKTALWSKARSVAERVGPVVAVGAIVVIGMSSLQLSSSQVLTANADGSVDVAPSTQIIIAFDQPIVPLTGVDEQEALRTYEALKELDQLDELEWMSQIGSGRPPSVGSDPADGAGPAGDGSP